MIYWKMTDVPARYLAAARVWLPTAKRRFIRWQMLSFCAYISILFFASINQVYAKTTTLPVPVAKVLAQKGVDSHAMSMMLADMDTGEVVASHLPDKKRLPASTLKLVTTLAALDTLGGNFRWRTGVYANGRIIDNTLKGDLIIKGGGDPKLVLERLVMLFDELKARGIEHISGDMVLDNGVFSGIRHNPEQFDGKGLRPYNVAPDGLLTNFGAMILKFYPDEAAGVAYVAHEPEVAEVAFPYSVALDKNSSCGDWRSKVGGRFTAKKVSFSGRYPAACGEQYWPVAYPAPSKFAPRVLAGMWQLAGGTLDGKARYGKLSKGAKHLYDLPSLPLAQLITDINQFSNNVMTEQVFLSLPVYTGKRTSSDYPTSRAWLQDWWRKHIDQDPPHFFKASGLCRDCYVTARQLIKVLKMGHSHSDAQVFKDSLGVAGVSGTIKRFGSRLPNSPAIGRAYIKTGTLNDVTSVAGYVDTLGGRKLAVVGIINTKAAARAKPVLDALIDWTVRQ